MMWSVPAPECMAKGGDNWLTLDGPALFAAPERNARRRSATGGSAWMEIFERAATSNVEGGVALVCGDPV